MLSEKQLKLLNELETTPTIQEQLAITDEWWEEVDVHKAMEASLSAVARFFVKKGFCPDEMVAEKTILAVVGHDRAQKIGREGFSKMFSKPIFRIALLDMLRNIQELSKDHEDLPLLLKLAAYRRHLLLCGLDKEESEHRDKGQSILDAMQLYKELDDPAVFRKVSFQDYAEDPFGRRAREDGKEVLRKRYEKFEKLLAFSSMKK